MACLFLNHRLHAGHGLILIFLSFQKIVAGYLNVYSGQGTFENRIFCSIPEVSEWQRAHVGDCCGGGAIQLIGCEPSAGIHPASEWPGVQKVSTREPISRKIVRHGVTRNETEVTVIPGKSSDVNELDACRDSVLKTAEGGSPEEIHGPLALPSFIIRRPPGRRQGQSLWSHSCPLFMIVGFMSPARVDFFLIPEGDFFTLQLT